MRLVALSLFASTLLLPIAAPRAQCGGTGNSVLQITSPTGVVLKTGVEALIRLNGDPGDPFLLMFDVGPGTTFVPGIGTICLPLTSLLAFPGVIPAGGMQQWPKTVCGVPCGFSVSAQALFMNSVTDRFSTSNRVSMCFCSGCVGKMLDLTATTYFPYTSSFPVTIVAKANKKEANGELIGRTEISFDPANRPAFPISDDGCFIIENIAMVPGGFYVVSTVDARKSALRDHVLPADTCFDITAGGLRNCARIHSSCSRPIGIGVEFGPYLVTGLNSTEGSCSGSQVLCAGKTKIGSLDMRYNGGDGSASSHSQSASKATCSGSATAATVWIRASNKQDPEDSRAKVWFAGPVKLNDTFTIDSAGGGKTKLESATWVHIYDASGTTLLQTLGFHTSCSQPLALGDVFGSLEVVDFTIGG